MRWPSVKRVLVYLEDDLVQSDEVLGLGPPLVLVVVRVLQLGLQRVGHALVPLHHRAQLDVAQVARAGTTAPKSLQRTSTSPPLPGTAPNRDTRVVGKYCTSGGCERSMSLRCQGCSNRVFFFFTCAGTAGWTPCLWCLHRGPALSASVDGWNGGPA